MMMMMMMTSIINEFKNALQAYVMMPLDTNNH